MSTLRDPVRVGLALIMAIAGIAHFASPRPFIDHLPAAVPLRAELVAVTGAIEIGLAVALIGPRRWRDSAGRALAAYLVLVFPANIYAAVSQVPIEGVPTGWVRWARLALQAPLIVAAVWSTRVR